MKVAGSRRFDVAALRRDHPIEVVVAASGVALTQHGKGFMGCCPFHDDSTASLSVGGVAERFHCFGCAASGDVIEYVHRFTGLTFVDAVQALESGSPFGGVPPATLPQLPRTARTTELTTTSPRAHAINLPAWRFCTTPPNTRTARTDRAAGPAPHGSGGPLLPLLPRQRCAHHPGVARGTDGAQPRNLAKSVTVE